MLMEIDKVHMPWLMNESQPGSFVNGCEDVKLFGHDVKPSMDKGSWNMNRLGDYQTLLFSPHRHITVPILAIGFLRLWCLVGPDLGASLCGHQVRMEVASPLALQVQYAQHRC